MNHPIWSIWPLAANQLQAQAQQMIAAGLTTEQLENISAGPIEDAENAGLPVKSIGTTAVITLRGPMTKNPGIFERLFFGAASTRATQLAVGAAGADEDVERIVLVTDTPGGSVAGLAELGDTIAAVSQEKPVIVQVDGLIASAGYYIGSQATEIRAGRMDMVGSIGTRMMLYDYSGMFEEKGVKAIPIDTGWFKSAGALGTEITEDQQAEFQRMVDGYFADFKAMVMKGRNFSAKQFEQVNDGRMWLAADALDLGLIDKIASTDETLAEIRAAAKPTRSAPQNRARFHQAAQELAEIT